LDYPMRGADWRGVDARALPAWVRQFCPKGNGLVKRAARGPVQQPQKAVLANVRRGRLGKRVVPEIPAVRPPADVVEPRPIAIAPPVRVPDVIVQQQVVEIQTPVVPMDASQGEPEVPVCAPCTCSYSQKRNWGICFVLSTLQVLLVLLCFAMETPLPMLLSACIVVCWWFFASRMALSYECLVCRIERLAEQYSVDQSMLSFSFQLAFLATRDQARLRELKLRLQAWMRQNHSDWSDMVQACQLVAVMRATTELADYELDWISHFESSLKTLHSVHNFAARGELNSGQTVPQR